MHLFVVQPTGAKPDEVRVRCLRRLSRAHESPVVREPQNVERAGWWESVTVLPRAPTTSRSAERDQTTLRRVHRETKAPEAFRHVPLVVRIARSTSLGCSPTAATPPHLAGRPTSRTPPVHCGPGHRKSPGCPGQSPSPRPSPSCLQHPDGSSLPAIPFSRAVQVRLQACPSLVNGRGSIVPLVCNGRPPIVPPSRIPHGCAWVL